MHLIQQKILEPQHTLEQLSRMISESMFTFKWLAILLFECFYPILVTLSWIFEDLSSYVLIESITGGIPAYQGIIKKLVLHSYKGKFREIMESLKKFWPKDKFGEIQLTAIKEGEAKTIKILKMYNTVMWTGFVALCSMPLVQRKNLPVTWMSFCDIQNNLYCYIFNYILQIICIAKLLHLLLSMDTLLFILLWHGYSELEKIKHGLLQFNISNFSETVAAHGIASLVEQHCSVLIYIRKIFDLFSNLMLFQLLTSSAALVTSLFVLKAEDEASLVAVMTYVPYLSCCFMQAFLYCALGQTINMQTANIADAAYASNWIEKNASSRKALCLVIQRAQKPEQMTAGGVFTLNMETFISMMKGVLSVVAFLQAVTYSK